MKRHMAKLSWEEMVFILYRVSYPSFKHESKSLLKTRNVFLPLEIRIFLLKSTAEIFFLTINGPF